MHSFWHRVNTVLTLFGTVAAGLCVLTTLTDVVHTSDPKVSIGLREVKRLTPYLGTKDQAVITFDVDADLRSAFSWNTKQLFVYLQAEYVTIENKRNEIVLWDLIIQKKEKAHIKLRGHKTKYAFIDQGKNLRGKDFNLTLVWNVMPKVGYLYLQRHSVPAGPLPSAYQTS